MNIIEIAGLCGVSPATVSRVINNNPSVSAATCEKVLRVLRETDYTPNAFASGIGRNSMRLVGILCADISNLYYAKAVSLLVSGLRNNGFDALLCCTGTALADKKAALSDMLQKRVDAIILVGSAYREERDNNHVREAAKQVPIFLVNAHVQIPNVYCVVCNEREAIQTAVHSMAATGRRRILYLHDMKRWAWAGTQKMQGYLDGLADSGAPVEQQLIQCVDSGMSGAADRVAGLLESGVAFDGIITTEDLLAIGAQKAVNDKKVDIPIVGFNNSQYALCCTPELSSMDNMLDTICPMAVSMLNGLLNGEKISTKVVVSARLIERETFKTTGDA